MINIENVLRDHGIGVGISKQKYLDMERRAINGEAIADITDRTIGASGFFYDLFDNTNDHSCGVMDNRKTTASQVLSAGTTILTDKVNDATGGDSINGFPTGCEITLQQKNDDGVTETKEYVTVTNGGVSEESVVIDRSVPTTVVASAYTTSKDARPQILSNGWIVSVVKDTSVYLQFYVDKQDGNGFIPLCNLSNVSTDVSIASNGTFIYVIKTYGTVVRSYYFDATIVSGSITATEITIDTQSSFGTGCSLIINPTGTELHATWSSKNATYPNSFNIRYAKGTISAVDGSVSWGSVEQVSIQNNINVNLTNPCITIKDNKPIIVVQQLAGSNYFISCFVWNGSSWLGGPGSYDIQDYTTYAQSSPDAICDENGILWVTWQGKDATHPDVDNIHCKYSSDGGVTWVNANGATDKLTIGNVYRMQKPSITSDKNANVYILFNEYKGANIFQVSKIVYDGTVWSNITTLTSISTQNANYPPNPSTCSNYNDFTDAISVYSNVNQDTSTGSVQFRGIFSQTSQVPHLEITPLQHSYKTNVLIYRSLGNVDTVNGRLGFSDGFQSTTTYDRSTPTTVVNSAYDTSGNGGRKLVRLSNGWLVCAMYDSPNNSTKFYVSKDNGATWSQLCMLNGQFNGFSITSYGTKVHMIASYQGAVATNRSLSFDATTVTNIDMVGSTVIIDSGQTMMGANSITIDSLGNLHACWSSKNSTYPNSFNLRFSKSVDGGATWSAVTQVTNANTSTLNWVNPCIVIRNNLPIIIFEQQMSGSYAINCNYFNGTTWLTASNGTGIQLVQLAYTQSDPSSIVKKYGSNIGRIWTAWHGLDSTDTTKQNVRVNYSDDSGTIWNTATKITTGNTVDRKNVSLTEDTSGNVYAVYEDNGTLVYQVCNNGTTTFGGLTTIGTGTNVSALDNSSEVSFTKPLIVYMSASTVKFYGLWEDIVILPLLEEDIRYAITPPEAVPSVTSWINYDHNANFSIDTKISLVSSASNENYGTPTKTYTKVVDVNTDEDQYAYMASSNDKITQRITMTRTNTGDDTFGITKLLGAIG